MSWFVYIILTKKEKLYTGISTDPERRFVEHLCDRKKGAKYFRSDSPIVIIYLEEFKTMSEALKREIAIKKFPKKKKWDLVTVNTDFLIDDEKKHKARTN